MNTDVPIAVQRQIVEAQINAWKQARLDVLIARRVSQAIGDDLKQHDERLTRIEKALVELETILGEIEVVQ